MSLSSSVNSLCSITLISRCSGSCKNTLTLVPPETKGKVQPIDVYPVRRPSIFSLEITERAYAIKNRWFFDKMAGGQAWQEISPALMKEYHYWSLFTRFSNVALASQRLGHGILKLTLVSNGHSSDNEDLIRFYDERNWSWFLKTF